VALRQLAEKHPWLLAYTYSSPPPSRAGGRPAAAFPRASYSCKLTAEDVRTLDIWQKRLSALLGRALSRGETSGFVTALLDRRLGARNGDLDDPERLAERLLPPADENRTRLHKLAQAYPYIGMYAASLEREDTARLRVSHAQRQRLSLRLTRSEVNLLDRWQHRLSQILPAKPQRGETIGILAWVANSHFEAAVRGTGKSPASLEELLRIMAPDDL
jgi:hypothetical protein